MQPDYSNHTLYSLKSPTERYLWFTYQLLIVLLSLVGDTIILVGSRRYNAFNLHKLLVGIIEHLAVADMVYSVLTVAQGAVTLAADRWVLGDFLCHARVYVGYWDYCCIMWFTAALTVSKNLVVKYPYKSQAWSKHHAHRICSIIWIGCLAMPISIVVLMGLDYLNIEKDYVVYKCGTNTHYPQLLWWPMRVATFIFLALPNILVFSGTIYLIYQAVKLMRESIKRRTLTSTLALKPRGDSSASGESSVIRAFQGRTVKWQGLLTVLATALIHCFSSLPLILYFILRGFISHDNTLFHVTYNRTALYISYLNLACNFFVNVTTVPSFRNFVRHKVLRLRVSVSEVGLGTTRVLVPHSTVRGVTVTQPLIRGITQPTICEARSYLHPEALGKTRQG